MNITKPPLRPIKRLLVANRGEIATRIISAARELSLETFAVFTDEDSSHTLGAAHSLKLSSPASYLDIDELVRVVRDHKIDAVHPGYGFLSESADFAWRMWKDAACAVVGPGWEILARTGDKLQARILAESCHVPVSPAMTDPTNNLEHVQAFADQIGYPIMIKAVDGGGGRGIRLVRDANALPTAFERAVKESPSRQVFAERAAIDGFHHIEVQIVGDGQGGVRHLWERECSIQRRYQKVIELAPSLVKDRALISKVIQDAITMAQKICYFSLGTFEFLVNPVSKEYFFLEINPRLQVEHTISESISSVDIVRIQLLLSQGWSLGEVELPSMTNQPCAPPPLVSIQLRITAENVANGWSLSVGKINSFRLPSGHGIRVDTDLVNGRPYTIGADFDSLIAKIIVTASSWPAAVAKAKRALEDTCINGINTNIGMLRAIIAHPDFAAQRCDTTWLESNQDELLAAAAQMTAIPTVFADFSNPTPSSSNSVLMRKGEAWSIKATPIGENDAPSSAVESKSQPIGQIQMTRIMRNDFPQALVAEALISWPGLPETKAYRIDLASTLASTGGLSSGSDHQRGNPSNPSHVVIPFPGKLVELLIDVGDIVKEGDVICVVQQMKMELEVRALRSGRVLQVLEAEDGDQLAEGTLAAIIEDEFSGKLKL